MSNRACANSVFRVSTLVPELLERRWLFATITVDDSGGANFTSIQAAVTAANPGDNIRVMPGTYNERVTIPANKDDLKIRSERRWEAVIRGTGGTAATDDAVVKVDGADGVEIRGFKVTAPGNNFEYGILVTNGGSAQIRENWVTGINNANPNFGVGIAIINGSHGDVRDNRVDDYQKAGIAIDGAGSTASVNKNVVTGDGSTSVTAQNGIQVSDGARADVRQNTVSKNLYSPKTVSAAGILLSSAGAGTTVSQNEVFQNDVNIAVDFTDGATIEKNRVTGATFDGITLFDSSNNRISQNRAENNAFNGISLFDGSDFNLVEKNDSNRNGRDGIAIGNSDDNRINQNTANDNVGDGIYLEPTSERNRISKNSMFGNDRFDAEDESTGTGTAGTANFWEKNKGQTENRPGLLEKGSKGNGHGQGQGRGHGPNDERHGGKHSKWAD